MPRTSFAITSRWPDPPKANEKDLAEISILLGDRVLTRLLDLTCDQTRDFIRASAVSLAFWFADNWWRLRWEPIPDYRFVTADWRLRHELTSASGGIVWPPLMIYGVGARVVIAPISTSIEVGEGPLEYRPIPVSLMPASAYESGIEKFFEAVLARCAHAQDGAALTMLIQQLEREWKNPEVAAWRQLEAKLGFDPDRAPDGLIESFSSFEEAIGAEAIEEAAVASPGASSPIVLERAIEASRASKIRIDLSTAKAVVEPGDRTDFSRPIWAVAEDAAARLRRAMGRTEGPFLNQALGDVLQERWENIKSAPSTANDLPYGARIRNGERFERVALQTKSAHDRRFELARVLGDAVWSGYAQFGVISRGKTDRQKYQRAFAQSLLCPFDDLRHHVDLIGPTDQQIEAAARRYHVHRSVVRTLLVNKGFLPRETLADVLEAA